MSRLKLYIGAGLTIKNAFLRIGEDYIQDKTNNGKVLFLYEELLIVGNQLKNNQPENMVYREWGRRCEVSCCRKLGFLLASSLRQGNGQILLLLEKEVCLVQEEQRKKARKAGEEAGTKLLLPMMLMLLMVMGIVLIPAFGGMKN